MHKALMGGLGGAAFGFLAAVLLHWAHPVGLPENVPFETAFATLICAIGGAGLTHVLFSKSQDEEEDHGVE